MWAPSLTAPCSGHVQADVGAFPELGANGCDLYRTGLWKGTNGNNGNDGNDGNDHLKSRVALRDRAR